LYTQNGYNFLLTIPPASIEPERALSSAGILCSKLRSRMTDAVLDSGQYDVLAQAFRWLLTWHLIQNLWQISESANRNKQLTVNAQV